MKSPNGVAAHARFEAGPAQGEFVIPLVVQPYDEQFGRTDWECRARAWGAKRDDPTLLGPYADLADPGEKQFIVLWRDQPGYGWPEATVALAMKKAGFTCWTGVQFFPRYGARSRQLPRSA